MEYQLAVRIGIFSTIKSGLGNPAGGNGTKNRQQSQSEIAPVPSVRDGTHKKTKLHNCNLCAEDLGQSHANSLVVQSL